MKKGESTSGNLKCSRFFNIISLDLCGLGFVLVSFFKKQSNSALFDSSVFCFTDHFPTSRTRLHFLFSLQYQKKVECESIFKVWMDNLIRVWVEASGPLHILKKKKKLFQHVSVLNRYIQAVI